MRAPLIAFSFLAGLISLPCLADGMEPPEKAASASKAAPAKAAKKSETAAKTAGKAGKADASATTGASAKAEAGTKAEAPAKAKSPAKKTAAKKPPAPVLPDDLTPYPIRHVTVCPPPKVAPCVMKKPVNTGYRVLTTGVDVADDGANWIVDFGKGPKGSPFLLQVLETGGRFHEVEVKFQAKAGMQKTSALPAE